MNRKENTEEVVEKIECLGKLYQRYSPQDLDKDQDLFKAIESKLKELVNKL